MPTQITPVKVTPKTVSIDGTDHTFDVYTDPGPTPNPNPAPTPPWIKKEGS